MKGEFRMVSSSESLLKSTDKTLCSTIRGRVIWCATNMFHMLALRNSLNSSAVNCGPLSDTSCSGNPNEENNRHNSWMVADEVVEIIEITSGLLE